MADETIQELITRIVIDTADSMQKSAQFQTEIEKIKTSLRELVSDSKTSVGNATRGVLLGLKEQMQQLDAQIVSIRSRLKEVTLDIRGMTGEQLGPLVGKTGIKPGAETRAVQQQLIADAKAVADAEIQSIKLRKVAYREYISYVKAGSKEITTEQKSAIKDVDAAYREYIQSTKQGFVGVMSPAAKQYGQYIQELKTQIVTMSREQGISLQQAGAQFVQAKTPIRDVNQALKEMMITTNQGPSIFQKLGTAIQMALGLGLYQVIMKIVSGIKEFIKSSYELTKAMYQLQVGVNVLRRSGMEVTLQEIYTNLDKLQKKFGVFSKKELVEGAAQFANLVRDMQFTKEEFFALQDAVATLAVINGRAMDEVQRTVALALSSGYTEGLQRLGVSINRVNIALKAEELGYGRVYMSLTEAQRGEATQILILEKTAKYMDDLETYQKTAPGQIDKMSAAWKDFKSTLFTDLLPYLGMFAMALTAILKWVSKVAPIKLYFQLIGFGATAIQFAYEALKILVDTSRTWEDKIPDLIALNKELANSFIKIGLAQMSVFAPNLAKRYEEMYKEMGFLQEKLAELSEVPTGDFATMFGLDEEAMNEMMGKYIKGMKDSENKLKEDRIALNKKLQQDLAEIELDGARKRKAILDDFDEKIAKINAEERKDRANAINKYNLDVVQTNRQFNQRRSESESKYRENQIKAEIDYQERLKKLREGFLMDLDEALHERDARQILRLIKQYNLQKTQAAREQNIALDEMKRAHVLELQEIETQRQERLRILWEELQAKVAAIREDARLKREAAAADKAASLIELEDRLTKERDAKNQAYRQELADLHKANQDRMGQLLLDLIDEYNLTKDMLDKIMGIWMAAYGPNGDLEAAGAYAISLVNEINAAIISAMEALRVLTSGKGYGKQGIKSAPKAYTKPRLKSGRASGGIDYATKATSLTFGEAGPEMAITMPLSRGFSGNQYLNGNPISSLSGGSKNGSIDIALLLSPDLEARIVRKSGDTIANVLLEVQRQR